MSALALRVRLDPAPAHRAQLAAYPSASLWPDFAVLASGAVAIDLGPNAVAYRRGQLIPLAAGTDDPAVWLPDYLGGFLPRLAGAVLDLRPGAPTLAHFVDAPAALAFEQQEDGVMVTFLDGDRPAYAVTVPRAALYQVAATALATFLAGLLAINPRLADQPDVVALQQQHTALVAASVGGDVSGLTPPSRRPAG